MAEKIRLYEIYKSEVIPALMKELGYKNVNEVPKIVKITLNMGLGNVKDNPKSFALALEELTLIAGQKAQPTLAKKSISNFKLREGMKVGARVTLRGKKMYEFLDRLISIALPLVRDFRGLSNKAFDGKGNYSLGIKEQLIFPEINYDKVEKVRGLDINIITTAKTDADSLALLKALGMPFRNQEVNSGKKIIS
ncbi:MAG: 50S ribosomal protein L5 [Clostridia bacterium]|jgi:large subunit ribosomal protein L5|nr:50S ribosomal protein L5 [Clostridia bacterium]MDD3231858.1 50S ribosomal protein L5 [Clostridia bacterium]MDD3862491.1 50S ribosomal protein L5 [Clostridia bacterium]MDD4408461.1 50S ribosomal protein L5 [Clostridia bacterium]